METELGRGILTGKHSPIPGNERTDGGEWQGLSGRGLPKQKKLPLGATHVGLRCPDRLGTGLLPD